MNEGTFPIFAMLFIILLALLGLGGGCTTMPENVKTKFWLGPFAPPVEVETHSAPGTDKASEYEVTERATGRAADILAARRGNGSLDFLDDAAEAERLRRDLEKSLMIQHRLQKAIDEATQPNDGGSEDGPSDADSGPGA